MGRQFETVEHRIAHVFFVVADNALLDLHAFHKWRFNLAIIRRVVALFTGKIFLVPFMRKPGRFLSGGTLQFHAFRSCITCHTEAAAGKQAAKEDQDDFEKQ